MLRVHAPGKPPRLLVKLFRFFLCFAFAQSPLVYVRASNCFGKFLKRAAAEAMPAGLGETPLFMGAFYKYSWLYVGPLGSIRSQTVLW